MRKGLSLKRQCPEAMFRKRPGLGRRIRFTTPKNIANLRGNCPNWSTLVPENEMKARVERRYRKFHADFGQRFRGIQ